MMVMAVFLLASCQETPKGYVINGCRGEYA